MSKGQITAIIVAVIVAVSGIALTVMSGNPKKPNTSDGGNNSNSEEESKLSENTTEEVKSYKLEEIVSEIVALADEQSKK